MTSFGEIMYLFCICVIHFFKITFNHALADGMALVDCFCCLDNGFVYSCGLLCVLELCQCLCYVVTILSHFFFLLVLLFCAFGC